MSVAKFSHCNSITTVQDTVTKLYKSVVEMTMKPKFENGYGPSNGASNSGVRSK